MKEKENQKTNGTSEPCQHSPYGHNTECNVTDWRRFIFMKIN